jgi:3-keto-5-aminohexanoate cleavage enzyme
MTTGVIGPDVSGPVACLARVKPELAAANAGTLNYLKTRADGSWAWPPMVFDNPVEKVSEMLAAMHEHHVVPELECFDVGIVRSVGLYVENGMLAKPHYNFVMGVASGMPADAELLPILVRYLKRGSPWQATLIGRQEIWPVHRRAAELGGHLRTGLEDTFYLPDGERARGNGELVDSMVRLAREVGREVATPAEARAALAA